MLRLIQTDNGQFDLAPDDGSADAAVQTLVYAALFTDARAPEGVAEDRRGWWDAPDAGSGLWYVRRQPLSLAARRQVVSMVRTTLLSHGVSGVSIQEVELGGSGSVSAVVLEISGSHNGRRFVIRTPLP